MKIPRLRALERPRLKWFSTIAVAIMAAAVVVPLAVTDDGYELKVLMPSAGKAFVGGQVMLHGEPVGEITDLGVRGNKALVTTTIDDRVAPMHAGTTARITWKSVIGARVLELLPGPKDNPELPDGKMIKSKHESVQLDDLLAMLDKPTRKNVQGLVGKLRDTLRGREQDVKKTVATGGPALEALGQVLRAVGEDGPAIRKLVTQLHKMTSQLANRDDELGNVVQHLGTVTSKMAGKQQQLTKALSELPSTVRQAGQTLARVPGAVDATKPLLADLKPVAQKLPEVAGNLSPVLQRLRPAVGALKPTLRSANQLLQRTPRLLDSAHDVLPGVTHALQHVGPAVSFLRPYTPELAGWLSNWVSIFGSQNSNGRNIARALITASGSSATDNPGVVPPGMKQDPRPAPGSLAGQPWTDAYGDGVN